MIITKQHIDNAYISSVGSLAYDMCMQGENVFIDIVNARYRERGLL